MTPERWQQVKVVVDTALALDEGARPVYLDDACAGDAGLRHEVDSLLRHHQQAAPGFLNRPPLDQPQLPRATASGSRTGFRVGGYELLEPIGEGGMGSVYRAARVDGQYEKQVAIKLVRAGYDSSAVLERFRTERQILAGLDHPNIARLLDGGTTEDGAPYLVMELVDGVRIDSYCDDHRLTIAERLQLFRHVCAAVQYAHQRLVVHRDIKPSNILVTSDGTPKLLDFGIAKIVDVSAEADVTFARPMTLAYASPEQVRGEPITTATDIYALGVVLYRLLTGQSPYRVHARAEHELSAAITGAEPERPSLAIRRPDAAAGEGRTPLDQARVTGTGSIAALQRRLSGDLDNILLTALRKEPNRRYSSVEHFAADIGNHLRGLPVSAAPDSWRYRTGKFVRRHRMALAAATALLLAIVVGAGVSFYQARRARREQAVAQQRFDMVRRLANAVVFEFNDALQGVPGTTAARKLIVTRAIEYLDSLSQQEASDIDLARELARAYVRIGDILGNPYQANLGDSAGALTSYRTALGLYDRLGRRDRRADTRAGMAEAYVGLGSLAWANGDGGEARANYTRAIAIYDELGRTDSRYRRNIATTAYFLGQTEYRFGTPALAKASYQRAEHELESLLAKNPDDIASRRSLSAAYMKLGDVESISGDLSGAVREYRRSGDALESLLSTAPSSTDFQRRAAIVWLRLAGMETQLSARERETLARRAMRVQQALAEADPSNVQAVADFGDTQWALGLALLDQQRDREASVAVATSVQAFERALAANPDDQDCRRGLGYARKLLGKLAMRRNDPRAALDQYDKARALLEAPDVAHVSGDDLADLYNSIGDAYAALSPDRCDADGRRTAAAWYRKSDSAWTAIASRRPLDSSEARVQREVTHKLARESEACY